MTKLITRANDLLRANAVCDHFKRVAFANATVIMDAVRAFLALGWNMN